METNNIKLTGGMKALVIINCILMIAIGCYLLFNLRYIVLLFSAAVFIQGITLIVYYLASKGARNGWDIISGVINVLFGAVMLFGGTETRVAGVLTIEVFVAVWALFAGGSHIINSFVIKKAGSKKWVWTLVGGILLVVCGFIYISMPLFGSLMLVGMAGIYASITFVIVGVTGLAAVLTTGGNNS